MNDPNADLQNKKIPYSSNKDAVIYQDPYHSFDSFRVQEAIVQSIHGFIRFYINFLSQEYGTSIKPVISIKDCESTFFVTFH